MKYYIGKTKTITKRPGEIRLIKIIDIVDEYFTYKKSSGLSFDSISDAKVYINKKSQIKYFHFSTFSSFEQIKNEYRIFSEDELLTLNVIV